MAGIGKIATLNEAVDGGLVDSLLDTEKSANTIQRAVVGRWSEPAGGDENLGSTLERIVERANDLIVVIG